MLKKFLTLIVVVAALTGGASAQSKIDPFDLHVASLRVLESRAVQKEIGISTAQRGMMDNFANKYNADLKKYVEGLRKSGKDPSTLKGPDAGMLKLLATLKRNVMGVLSAGQLKRLREISLQVFGLNGLLDDVVATKVGLSKEQLAKMRTTFEAGSKKANDMIAGAIVPVNNQFKNAKPKTDAEKKQTLTAYEGKRKEALDKIKGPVDQIRKDTRGKILAILTPTQKSTYLALQGKAFKAGA